MTMREEGTYGEKVMAFDNAQCATESWLPRRTDGLTWRGDTGLAASSCIMVGLLVLSRGGVSYSK